MIDPTVAYYLVVSAFLLGLCIGVIIAGVLTVLVSLGVK